MRILIVEDHYKINELLARFARGENHFVKQTFNATEGLKELMSASYDLLITDLMLPGLSGEELIKKIRETSDIYIMVISAKTEVNDRINSLSLGADDYLIKPFSVKEVMIKLKNIEKRLEVTKPVFFSFYHQELIISPLDRSVKYKEQIIDITNREFEVLLFLINNPFQVLTRDQIINHLGSESEAYDRVIDAYIKNLRRKLNDDSKNPKYIKTSYGLGYQFIGERDD
ncbi:MAG: response regulator transcription factor [Acholeplasma sp.]|jgi:DNA-binding response OmpR family regulator|nr:response regulator transcription factor [Acholeplasma sp.]